MIQLPFLANDQHGAPINFERTVTRDEVEQLDARTCSIALEAPCQRALADAGLSAGDIEEVLLVGGMTRWPAVQRIVERIFGKQAVARARTPTRSSRSAPPRTPASSPATPTTPRCSTSRRTTSASRSATRGFSVMIPRNSMLPVRARKLFATTRADQKFVVDRALPGRVARTCAKNRKLGQVVLDDLPPGPGRLACASSS